MKATDIRVGMTLKLKPQRQDAYNLTDQLVLVTDIKQHHRYKRVWVMSGINAYLPSDFVREIEMSIKND